MRFTVSVSPADGTSHESAAVLVEGPDAKVELYLDFTTLLRSVRNPSDLAQDFLLVAATVYALDKLVLRSQAPDCWTRRLDVVIPVANTAVWNSISGTANECLSYLSGDQWTVNFIKRSSSLIRRRRRQRQARIRPRFARGAAACLFSGGLDSLIGAIDWLEAHPGESLALVGHHDPGIGGALSDQKSLLQGIEASYSGRLSATLVGIGHGGKGPEITLRSRSLLFIALGLVIADHLGDGTPLLIPENGTIALNVPLTPSRRGSCSTRTAHPFFLDLLRKWLSGIGLDHPLENLLIDKTKGEAVSKCLNRPLLEAVFRNSVSCAKRGHTSTWINKSANGCGRCMPCIYRRAALHASGLDDEIYGRDVCKGEVVWADPNSEAADDFGACLSFLLRNPSRMDIAKMLIANGHLSPFNAMTHAGTVQRAMDEVRKLISDNGTAAVKHAAGLRGSARRAN